MYSSDTLECDDVTRSTRNCKEMEPNITGLYP